MCMREWVGLLTVIVRLTGLPAEDIFLTNELSPHLIGLPIFRIAAV